MKSNVYFDNKEERKTESNMNSEVKENYLEDEE